MTMWKSLIPLALKNSHPALRPSFPSLAGSPWMLHSRAISQTLPKPYLETEGKTAVTIHNHEADAPLMVDTYHENGFKLNNGFEVRGPIAIFPKSVLAWDVGNSSQITPESLIIFTLLDPKLDVLIIGVGDPGKQNDVPVETIKMLKQKRVNFEILPTVHALTTFNFLNYEKRSVAAALLPPQTIKLVMEDLVRNRIDKRRIYDDPLF